MKIKVNMINSIQPTPPFEGILLNVTMLDHQAEELFYELWEIYGSETFKKWINAEGFLFVQEYHDPAPSQEAK